MIVVDFYIARTDLFKRDAESVEEHTARMIGVMDAQWKTIADGGAGAVVEIKDEWPDWLVALIESLPPLPWHQRLVNWFRGIAGRPARYVRVRYDDPNRIYKVFFETLKQAKYATGWRTKDYPDVDGVFQTKFKAAIANDADKAAWSKTHRLQISDLVEIDDSVIASDGDLQDFALHG